MRWDRTFAHSGIRPRSTSESGPVGASRSPSNASVVVVLLPALRWFGRKLFERRWAKEDRFLLRAEVDLETQLEYLRDLNGKMFHKWRELENNWDKTGPAMPRPSPANSNRGLYEHAPYFPEKIRVTLISLGILTGKLAAIDRDLARLSPRPEEWAVEAWLTLRRYQREVEKKLRLG